MALGVFVALVSIVAWQRESIIEAYYFRSVRAVTTALPHCDRVELFDARSGGIGSSQTLSGTKAESFAALWRAQTYGPEFTKLCHTPVYGLRFYSGSKLRFETTLCFRCSNFRFTDDLFGSGSAGFDTSTQKAEELLRRLQEAFLAPFSRQK